MEQTDTPFGSSGAFNFNDPASPIRSGEFHDFQAFTTAGALANITSWALVENSAGSLVNYPVGNSVRFIADQAGDYVLQATDAQGSVGKYRFLVESDAANLFVSEAVNGLDTDDVAASLAASGSGDLFLAELIGDTSAPQFLARIGRTGTREVSIMVPYKVQDLAADENSNVVAIRTAATLTDALIRFDRDFVEDPGFMAPGLMNNNWRDLVAMKRDGEIIIVTDRMGGQLLRLDATGAPVGGTVPQSVLPLPLPYADIVDVATDHEGSIYVATETAVARVLSDGSVDQTYWLPDPQTALRNIAADDRGILYLAAQDADGGQCGSLRTLDWSGSQVRRITTFESGSTEFAARKILDPVSLAAYADGGWRLYDDIVTLNPAVQRASWILAAEPVNGTPSQN